MRPLLASTSEESRTASDRKSTRLNSSHGYISYAVFCLKKKKIQRHLAHLDHTQNRQRRLEVHLTHIVNFLEVLIVANIDIVASYIIDVATSRFYCLFAY